MSSKAELVISLPVIPQDSSSRAVSTQLPRLTGGLLFAAGVSPPQPHPPIQQLMQSWMSFRGKMPRARRVPALREGWDLGESFPVGVFWPITARVVPSLSPPELKRSIPQRPLHSVAQKGAKVVVIPIP